MFKKFAIAVPMTLLALSTSAAFAANDASTTINITAEIPNAIFHAKPVNPEFGEAEKMNFNLGNRTLSPVRGQYDVLNTAGAVNAYVQGGPPPLFNGTPALSIPLTYTFNGIELSADPQLVVSDVASNTGLRTELVITAATPTATQFGSYSATPVVIFDALTRTGSGS